MHLLGDAGYKIWGHLLTPSPEGEALQDRRRRLYNYLYPKTRIIIECAFGRLKNRFSILQGKLEQKTAERVCKIVLGCTVLHNLLVLVKDGVQVEGADPLLREAPTRPMKTCMIASRSSVTSKAFQSATT